MKKLFTIDGITVAFISAPGYGFGETMDQALMHKSLTGMPCNRTE